MVIQRFYGDLQNRLYIIVSSLSVIVILGSHSITLFCSIPYPFPLCNAAGFIRITYGIVAALERELIAACCSQGRHAQRAIPINEVVFLAINIFVFVEK